MSNRRAIGEGLTIQSLCPGISQQDLAAVAEILATTAGTPERTLEARKAKLDRLAPDDAARLREHLNKVIRARNGANRRK